MNLRIKIELGDSCFWDEDGNFCTNELIMILDKLKSKLAYSEDNLHGIADKPIYSSDGNRIGIVIVNGKLPEFAKKAIS